MRERPAIRRTGAGATHIIDHAHPHLELNLIVSGKGTYFVGDGQHDLVPGTLVWLLPDQRHQLMRTPELDMWVANFASEDLESDLLEDLQQRPCRLLSSEDAIALDRLLSSINQDTDEPSLYRAGMRYALRSAWRFTMTSPGPARKPMHPSVLEALSILRSSDEPPTSAELARRCGIAQKYLGQLLIEHTGQGFVEWRNRARLERFHSCYPRRGDLLSAALEAGFGSYAQFHRVFSEVIGMTPGEWVKRGGRSMPIALPSQTATIVGSSAGSTRMAWYPLAEHPLESASRWFPKDFGAKFLEVAGQDEADPIDSEVISLAELRQFEPDFVAEMMREDQGLGDRLDRIFTRFDIFEEHHLSFSPYQLGNADLGVIIAIYLAYAIIVTNHLANPSRQQLIPLINRLRAAMAKEGLFAQASPEDRRRTAAAFMCQSIFLNGAMEGARASGSDAIAERIAAAARATAQATLGIDPLAMQLPTFAS